jgi:hypothetical protein
VDAVRDRTGWDLGLSAELAELAPPSPAELGVVRKLLATQPAPGR